MAGNDSTESRDSPTALVPRYVKNLNALAERCGMTTRNYALAAEDEDELPTLRGEWKGTVAQLVSTGLFADSMVERIRGIREHSRFLASRGGTSHPEMGVLVGDVVPTDKGEIVYQINFGELPRAIRSEGPIELIEYSGETGLHGLPSDLVASGRCTARQMPKGRDAISSSHRWSDRPLRSFRSRRQPDGHVLVLIETELAMERRVAARRRDAAWACSRLCPPETAPAASQAFREDGFETVDVGPLLERFRRPPVKP